MPVTPINLAVTNITPTSARFGWELTPLIVLIRSLFGAGEQGAFYIPRPTVNGAQVLFQDSAGTVPVTADGDPVGLMLDQSGNGNHATQSVSGSRPVYRTDGTLNWLDPDGADDFFNVSNPLSYSSQNVLLAFSGGNDGRIFDNRGTGEAGTQVGLFIRTDVIAADDGKGTLVDVNVIQNPQPKVWTVEYSEAIKRLALRENGALEDEASNASLGSVISNKNAVLFAAANNNSQKFGGRFYGSIVREGLMTVDQTQAAESYLADLAGVAL